MPALKYHEGRAAMLAQIQRCIASGEAVAACLEAGKNRWDHLRRLARKSPDWAAYLQGAADVVNELDLDPRDG
jgi:hypothetical protein